MNQGIAQSQHPIYCTGEILHTIQTMQIFKDSKTFVDMPLKYEVDVVLQNWQKLAVKDKQSVQQFVSDNFLPAGSDSEKVVPSDWQANPLYINNIKSKELQIWASEVNKIWLNLTKRFTMSSQMSSLIDTPHPFFVPGGRFREFYYWDTMWVIDGLLISGMIESAIQMQQNFKHIIETYGYIPNGARIYYLGRTQPMVYPMITDKIYEYLLQSGQNERAQQFILDSFESMEKEFKFFQQNRGIRACTIFNDPDCDTLLYHYDTASTNPRPESYREDYELAISSGNKTHMYRELAAGAESGWDYSSRWFSQPEKQNTIHATNVIPVDLNVFIVINLRILAKFSKLLNESNKEFKYETLAKNTHTLIDKYLFDKDQWKDYLINEKKLSPYFYPSNYFPLLLTNSAPQNIIDSLAEVIKKFKGGIPTSMIDNGQQWDLPNSWPPLNQLLIEGLLKVNQKELALELAQNVINNDYCSYQHALKINGEGLMFEKYDANTVGKQGGGGEYEVQAGFGWTNGVAIWILNQFGQELKTPTC